MRRENTRVARRDARENTRVANETLKRKKRRRFFPDFRHRLAHRRASRGTTRADAPRTVARAEGHFHSQREHCETVPRDARLERETPPRSASGIRST